MIFSIFRFFCTLRCLNIAQTIHHWTDYYQMIQKWRLWLFLCSRVTCVSVSKRYWCLCSFSPESLMKLQMNRRQYRSMAESLWRCLMGTHVKPALVPVFLTLRPDSHSAMTLQEYLWMVWQNCSFIYNSFSSQVKPLWQISSETTMTNPPMTFSLQSLSSNHKKEEINTVYTHSFPLHESKAQTETEKSTLGYMSKKRFS